MTTEEALDRTLLLSAKLFRDAPPRAALVDGLCETRICLSADEVSLTTPGGQSAVVTAAQLIAACGIQVRLDVPEVQLRGSQPPIEGTYLRRGLCELGDDMIPGVTIELASPREPIDAKFVFGSTPLRDPSLPSWRVCATRWGGGIGPIDREVEFVGLDLTLGCGVAATLVAVEAFKVAMRRTAAKSGCAVANPELIEAISSVYVDLRPDHALRGPLALGPIDMVSGGAINSGCLHAMMRLPRATATVRVFDDDRLELSNLNRYPLARRSSVGRLKVDVLGQYATAGISVEPSRLRLDEANLDSAMPLADSIVVGTDNVETRWLLQSRQPQWLAVGATADFHVEVSEHRKGDACAGCLHPTADRQVAPLATASFVSYWAGLQLLMRLLTQRAGQSRLVQQASDSWPLRMDLPHARIEYAVMPNPACPVHGHHAPTVVRGLRRNATRR
jgi:ThiF family